jgi:tight adherence protein B
MSELAGAGAGIGVEPGATLAAVLAALAAALLVPVAGPTVRGRSAVVPLAVLAGVAAGGVVMLPRAWWGPALVLAPAAVGAVALRRAARRRRQAQRMGQRVLEFCDELAGELSCGTAPARVLTRAAADWPELGVVASAQQWGGSVPKALRGLAASPGAGDLLVVASAWELSERTGSGLADAIAAVGGDLRAGQRTRRVVASELASARATARLIAGLPILTLAAGSGAGHPVDFLLGTPVGLACLAAGLAFALAGLSWIEAIATGLERET